MFILMKKLVCFVFLLAWNLSLKLRARDRFNVPIIWQSHFEASLTQFRLEYPHNIITEIIIEVISKCT